jgi:hypothetical protein
LRDISSWTTYFGHKQKKETLLTAKNNRFPYFSHQLRIRPKKSRQRCFDWELRTRNSDLEIYWWFLCLGRSMRVILDGLSMNDLTSFLCDAGQSCSDAGIPPLFCFSFNRMTINNSINSEAQLISSMCVIDAFMTSYFDCVLLWIVWFWQSAIRKSTVGSSEADWLDQPSIWAHELIQRKPHGKEESSHTGQPHSKASKHFQMQITL